MGAVPHQEMSGPVYELVRVLMEHSQKAYTKKKIDQVGRERRSIIADAGNSSVVSLWSVSMETLFYGQMGFSLLVKRTSL